MFRVLSKLLDRVAHPFHSKPAPVRRDARLQVEGLESRVVPAAISVSYSSSGALYIFGTSGNDNVSVQWLNGKYNISANTDGVAWDPIRSTNYPDSSVSRVYFFGGNGNDSFDTSRARLLYTEAYGQGGNDILAGGAAGDYLDGGIGNDTLTGNGGADMLHGGDNDDTLYGGGNDDYLYGEAGNDILWGEIGNDRLFGGDNDDKLHGGDGSDWLYGGLGNDWLSGDWGNDFLYGEQGYDKLYGGGDNDYLDGGADGIADFLHGGIGADRFKGEWVPYNTGLFNLYRNLDYRADFDLAEGDSVDLPPVEIIRG